MDSNYIIEEVISLVQKSVGVINSESSGENWQKLGNHKLGKPGINQRVLQLSEKLKHCTVCQ